MMLIRDGCVKETEDPKKIEELESKGFKRIEEEKAKKTAV